MENVKIFAPGGAFLKKDKKFLFERGRARKIVNFYSFITENHYIYTISINFGIYECFITLKFKKNGQNR